MSETNTDGTCRREGCDEIVEFPDGESEQCMMHVAADWKRPNHDTESSQ